MRVTWARSPLANASRTRVEENPIGVPAYLQAVHGESQFGSEFAQCFDIAAGPVPEAEVLPDHHGPGSRTIHDEVLHEFAWTHPAEFAGERNDDDVIHACITQGIDALIEGDQHRGGILRGQHPPRMRVEGDCQHLTVAGDRPCLGDDGLVPAMHPIEHPDDRHGFAHDPEAYGCVLARLRR